MEQSLVPKVTFQLEEGEVTFPQYVTIDGVDWEGGVDRCKFLFNREQFDRLELGFQLCDFKRALPTGEFGNFLGQIGIAPRSATRYMKYYASFFKLPSLARVADLGTLELIDLCTDQYKSPARNKGFIGGCLAILQQRTDYEFLAALKKIGVPRQTAYNWIRLIQPPEEEEDEPEEEDLSQLTNDMITERYLFLQKIEGKEDTRLIAEMRVRLGHTGHLTWLKKVGAIPPDYTNERITFLDAEDHMGQIESFIDKCLEGIRERKFYGSKNVQEPIYRAYLARQLLSLASECRQFAFEFSSNAHVAVVK